MNHTAIDGNQTCTQSLPPIWSNVGDISALCLLCSQPSEPPPHLVRLYLWEYPDLNRCNHYSLKIVVVFAERWLLWFCAVSIGTR